MQTAFVKCMSCSKQIPFNVSCEPYEIRIVCYDCLKKICEEGSFCVFSELFFEMKNKAEELNAYGFAIWVYGDGRRVIDRLKVCTVFYLTGDSWRFHRAIHPYGKCRAILAEEKIILRKPISRLKIKDIRVDVLSSDRHSEYDVVVNVRRDLVEIKTGKRALIRDLVKVGYKYNSDLKTAYTKYYDREHLKEIIYSIAKKYKTAVRERVALLLLLR